MNLSATLALIIAVGRIVWMSSTWALHPNCTWSAQLWWEELKLHFCVNIRMFETCLDVSVTSFQSCLALIGWGAGEHKSSFTFYPLHLKPVRFGFSFWGAVLQVMAAGSGAGSVGLLTHIPSCSHRFWGAWPWSPCTSRQQRVQGPCSLGWREGTLLYQPSPSLGKLPLPLLPWLVCLPLNSIYKILYSQLF